MIYVAKTRITLPAEFIKSGLTTRDVPTRLGELQCGCPSRMEYVTEFDGDKDLEDLIHENLRPYRSGGGKEWYFLTPEVRGYFENFGVTL